MIQASIGLIIISAILLGVGWVNGNFPEKEDFALSFAIYAAIRANQEK